jgi:hypothetical protein
LHAAQGLGKVCGDEAAAHDLQRLHRGAAGQRGIGQ